MNKTRSREGQLLVEAVIAIGVFTIAIVGIIGIIARAIHEGHTVGDQFIAANLAAEGLEVTKNIIDSNVINNRPWNSGVSPGSYQVDYASASLGPQIITPGGSPASQYNSSGLQALLFNAGNDTYNYSSGSPLLFSGILNLGFPIFIFLSPIQKVC